MVIFQLMCQNGYLIFARMQLNISDYDISCVDYACVFCLKNN
jgi:hypothetical protein